MFSGSQWILNQCHQPSLQLHGAKIAVFSYGLWYNEQRSWGPHFTVPTFTSLFFFFSLGCSGHCRSISRCVARTVGAFRGEMTNWAHKGSCILGWSSDIVKIRMLLQMVMGEYWGMHRHTKKTHGEILCRTILFGQLRALTHTTLFCRD